MKFKIKNRKAAFSMSIEFIVAAIVIVAAGATALWFYSKNLPTQEKNLALLSNCKRVGGDCRPQCPPTGYTDYGSYGCPDEQDKNAKICCIPNEKSSDQIRIV